MRLEGRLGLIDEPRIEAGVLQLLKSSIQLHNTVGACET
jgi:hypothetical protein